MFADSMSKAFDNPKAMLLRGMGVSACSYTGKASTQSSGMSDILGGVEWRQQFWESLVDTFGGQTEQTRLDWERLIANERKAARSMTTNVRRDRIESTPATGV